MRGGRFPLGQRLTTCVFDVLQYAVTVDGPGRRWVTALFDLSEFR